MTRILRTLPCDPQQIADLCRAVEQVLSGELSVVPVPAGLDRVSVERGVVLRQALGIGQPIDPAIGLVIPTSGSTGTPKGAQLTAANVQAAVAAQAAWCGGHSHWLACLPLYHIAGFGIVQRTVVGGTALEVMDVSDGFDPHRFVTHTQALQQRIAGCTNQRMMVSVVPLQLAKLLTSVATIDALREYSAVLVGGGRIDPALLETCRKLHITVVSTYGSSETTGGVVYNGFALPGVSLEIDDDEQIWVSGPTVANGWRGVADAAAFHSRPGWYATGDRGYFDDDGALVVTGRLDNVIDTGGLKIQPELLEQQLLTCTGVDAAAIVGLPDAKFGHVLACAYHGDAHPLSLVAAFEDLPRWQLPKVMVPVDPWPVTGPGKTDRAAITRLLAEEYARVQNQQR
ncbi:o-succinylbenzoate--CoA ligase [Corynebacterium choanae]|uniref:2-succinylbenzoate--CoA ligase n=1 Tax=Corynebacterium choanae TaxID=1862358 RepID=A0A3G6JBI4_9CORY|nr:o-succinylbenzoate--CoA ligase [Corynebacterium choanae]AZA14458.1 2-succinylbenzoate--CoA ligase [Corynebacterium choanae]